jgi:hypothetical protein
MSQTAETAPNAAQIEYWNASAGETWAQFQEALDRQVVTAWSGGHGLALPLKGPSKKPRSHRWLPAEALAIQSAGNPINLPRRVISQKLCNALVPAAARPEATSAH